MTHVPRPHGLRQIKAIFGDIFEYISASLDGPLLSPEFEAAYITTVALAWDMKISVRKMRCHRLLADRILSIFVQIEESGFADRIESFGGCFNFRTKRGGNALSTHSWGIAIDLNPHTNVPGTSGRMSSGIVGIFENAGFVWGGRWSARFRDPMHFQYCSGY